MKIIYGFLTSLILTILLSILVPTIKITDGVLSTLYTISGIMFSIGMSLTVISNTSGVKNKKIRLKIRRQIKNVRNKFISCFCIVSFIYIINAIIPKEWNTYFKYFNFYWYLLLSLIYSVVYFTVNFISIQSFNEEIEEALNEK